MPSSRKTVQLKDASSKRSPERPKSRESYVTFSSGRSSTTTATKKESAVLTNGSLAILAREISTEKHNCIVFPMYLNIPTTTIVMTISCMSDRGLIGASDTIKAELTTKLLLDWKANKAPTVKDKEKVKELERGLKEMGLTEWADMVQEKHTSNTELTADAFASLK